jgi:shikimate dehydrogenase
MSPESGPGRMSPESGPGRMSPESGPGRMSPESGLSLSGRTELAAVIGDPIRHSLSPALFNAAFAELGMDWVMVAFELAAGHTAVAVDALRQLGWKGLSVTMPHKTEMSSLVDRLTPVAALLGAVNSVYRANGEVVGDSTDGAGFIDSLRSEGVEPAGRRCVVLGAGGAARAVVVSLAEAGASEIVILNRTREAAERAALLAPGLARLGQTVDVSDAELIINATPLGLASDSRMALDPGLMAPHHVVVDLVYHPEVTPLLRAAAEQGATTVGGLGMLVHQAGHQFRRWTGAEPPLAAMWSAVRAQGAPSRFSG